MEKIVENKEVLSLTVESKEECLYCNSKVSLVVYDDRYKTDNILFICPDCFALFNMTSDTGELIECNDKFESVI